MTIMPFICLIAGFLFTLKTPSGAMVKVVDYIINGALILLMVIVGMNIGINDSVIKNLGTIGLNCALISLFAIAGSVICVLLLEKTILPLEKISEKVLAVGLTEAQNIENSSVDYAESIGESPEAEGKLGVQSAVLPNSKPGSEKKEKKSPLIWIMPTGIIAGIMAGVFLMNEHAQDVIDKLLLISLVLLYTGVGFSMGTNKRVFKYVRQLGFKIVLISVAIFMGSAAGGVLAGILCGEPLEVSLMSASGMGYYSITGAYMIQTYGIETGTYGFIVNVMRDFFTIITIPLLAKISKGSPIAAGAAGNMDTMLVPVTKFVGIELGLVTLITGIILTIVVPIVLPLLAMAI